MSSQYPQYPQYSQIPGAGQDPGAGSIVPPDQPSAQPTYVPLEQVLPAGATPAELQSMRLTDIAAGKTSAELGVKAPSDPPVNYPLAMYNKQKRDTKVAKDEKEEQKLSGQGYTKDPLPPEDPNAVTVEMLQALQDVWNKAGDALKKLLQLAEQQQKQMQAAGAILGAGQQPGQAGQDQWGQQQNPYQPGYPYTPQNPGD